MSALLIYGAAGYTGRMAVARAKATGLDLVVAGRDKAKLARYNSVILGCRPPVKEDRARQNRPHTKQAGAIPA